MGNFWEGLAGGVGGFLSTGSVLGSAGGFLGGLFGEDEAQTTNYQYSQLSGAQQNMTNLGNDQLGELMAQLSPDAQNALIAQLESQYSGVLNQQTEDAFNLQSGRTRANMARTGGGPSSVLNTQMAQLGTERSKAMNASQMQATQMANDVGNQRFQQSLSATNSIGGLINQAESTRRVTSQTSTAPGTNLGSLMGGIGAGMTNPNSWYSQNQGALGAFGAPIFGSPAKATDTGGRLQGNAGFLIG